MCRRSGILGLAASERQAAYSGVVEDLVKKRGSGEAPARLPICMKVGPETGEERGSARGTRNCPSRPAIRNRRGCLCVIEIISPDHASQPEGLAAKLPYSCFV